MTMKKIDTEKSTILGINEDGSDNLKLGIRGYFSHYSNFETYTEGELEGFTYSEYMTTEEDPDGDYSNQWYDYFIPEDKVFFKETHRPYNTTSEFPFKIGEIITYKTKASNVKIKAMVVGAIEYIESQFPEKDLISVQFSNKSYSPDELLNYFEYLDPQTNKWLPFGVEE